VELQPVLKLSVAATLGCVLMTSTQSARANVVVIPELQAATLFGASATNNNSSSGPGMFVGSDGMGNPKRGLMEFDIPAFVPAGATITGASMSLVLGQVAGADATPRTIRLFDVTTTWAGGTNGTRDSRAPDSAGPGKDSHPTSVMQLGISPSLTRSRGSLPEEGVILFRRRVLTHSSARHWVVPIPGARRRRWSRMCKAGSMAPCQILVGCSRTTAKVVRRRSGRFILEKERSSRMSRRTRRS
jgi:hypothetical protein